MTKYVFAIDPGNIESGFAFVDTDTYKPIQFGKVDNYVIFDCINKFGIKPIECEVAIEMIASYGMAVGAEVFETCVWIGRFKEFFIERGFKVNYIYRREEKLCICHSPKANDSNIRIALADRFRTTETDTYAKGVKKNPGFFYGFSQDVWMAFCVAVVYIDKCTNIPF